MLVQLQFPLWDTRRIADGAASVLPSPGWPAPVPLRSFLHGIGMVRRRPLGGLTGWVGEDYYCELATWVHIPRRFTVDLGPARATPVRHLFSRFYFDGTLSGKIDIGFFVSNTLLTSIVRDRMRSGNGKMPIGVAKAVAVITEIATALLLIPTSQAKTGATGPLNVMLSRFVDALCYATTPRPLRTEDGLKAAREQLKLGPATLATETAGPLSHYLASTAKLSAAPGGGIVSVALSTSLAPLPVPVWHIFSEDSNGDRDDRRMLRIALLRLSSDLYCLRQLIAVLGKNSLALPPRSTQSVVLQEYIRQLCKRLRTDINAVQKTEAGSLATPIFQRLFEPGAVAAAFSRLQIMDVHPNIRDLLRETMDEIIDRGDSKPIITIGPGGVYVQGVVHGDVTTNVTMAPRSGLNEDPRQRI